MTDLTDSIVVIAGAGVSGRSAAALALARGAAVILVDSAADEGALRRRLRPLEERGVACRLGPEALAFDEPADLLVLSPGVPTDSELVRRLQKATGAPLMGEIEFASRFWDRPVFGITGTNGKTTSTGLTAHIMNHCGVRCVAAGNYGRPFCDVVLEKESFDCVALELSSFQLETIESFHPGISVWLNFAPDHMDRYRSVEEYRRAKQALFRNQTEDDWAIINAVEGPGIALRPRTLTLSSSTGDADFTLRGDAVCFAGEEVCRMPESNLRGKHNAENIMAAFAVGHAHGLSFADMRRGLGGFHPHPHRCELVGEGHGVEFINDSKATNHHALRSSLRAQTRPVILIAGGKDKGLPCDELRPLLGPGVTRVIAIGEIRHALESVCRGAVAFDKAETLEEAVRLAFAAASPGDTVLFSPGTSSFDMFTNYEERGNAFRNLVQNQLHNHVQETP